MPGEWGATDDGAGWTGYRPALANYGIVASPYVVVSGCNMVRPSGFERTAPGLAVGWGNTQEPLWAGGLYRTGWHFKDAKNK